MAMSNPSLAMSSPKDSGRCKYRDALGKVGEGAHSYRFLDIAIVDVVLTLLLALVTQLFLRAMFKIENVPLWLIFLVWLIVAEILHYIFCVETTFIKFMRRLFSTCN